MALQANELRIGNYFTSPNGNIQILSSIWQRDEVEWWGSNEAKAHFELSTRNPIPLTPEILKKCGFTYGEIRPRQPHWFIRVGIKGRFIQYESTTNKSRGVFKLFHITHWGGLRIEIKYMHQLQNLFYAETGEELNYTP